SGLQSRLHRFDSGRRLYWDCGPIGQGKEQTFGNAKGEAGHGAPQFIRSWLGQISLGGADPGMAEKVLRVVHARVAGDVVCIRMAEEMRVQRSRYLGTDSHVPYKLPQRFRR
ncbi:MAG: hypothetical protein WKF33_04295, partial [Thermoleophilaceae bacterium]